jgi:hypothetical protein
MFITNQSQIDSLKFEDAICLLLNQAESHYSVDPPLFLYLMDPKTKNTAVINLNHGDYFKWDDQTLPDLSSIRLFSPNKKAILANNIKTKDIVDLNFLIYPKKHKLFSLNGYITTGFYAHRNRYKSYEIYPLSILIGMCKTIAIELFSLLESEIPYIDDIKRFDNLYYNSLFKLEANPIHYDSNIIYSDYNPYTITNRPTNSSFGINLSALSKKDRSRNKLKTSFLSGNLVQFDYSSFHVYLLAKMLKFDIPLNGDVYIELNRAYKFSDADTRNQIKLDFFRYLYGNKKLENDLSNQIEIFKSSLSRYFELNGHLESFVLKRRIFYGLDRNIQSNKLFNYFLQNTETEYNLLKILELNTALSNKKSSIILYTYDSFLLDIPDDERDVIKTVKTILEQDNIPVNIQAGSNYGVLNDIY